MKAYRIDRFGSIGGIVRRSAEDPRPGPKEVLIRAFERCQRQTRWPHQGRQCAARRLLIEAAWCYRFPRLLP